MSDFETDLCILLSDVARHMRTYGNQLAQQHGTTLAQLTILERLQREPDITQNELAAITELSSMTVAWLTGSRSSVSSSAAPIPKTGACGVYN